MFMSSVYTPKRSILNPAPHTGVVAEGATAKESSAKQRGAELW